MFNADQDYAEACLPDVWRILFMQMRPHCVGHQILLRRIGSPFVRGGAATGKDLVLAALICSKTYESGEIFLRKRFLISAWILTLIVALIDGVNPRFVYQRAEALAQYMQEADRLPKGIFRANEITGGGGKKSYAPSALTFWNDLAPEFNITESEFLNMPLRQSAFLRYKLLEKDGLVWWRMRGSGGTQKEVAHGE